jgi:hypothetical protein
LYVRASGFGACAETPLMKTLGRNRPFGKPAGRVVRVVALMRAGADTAPLKPLFLGRTGPSLEGMMGMRG